MRASSLIFAIALVGSITPVFAEDCMDRVTADTKYADVIACLKEQQKSISSLREKLQTWSKDAPAVGNQSGAGDPKPATMCPEGYYAAGINWWGSGDATRYCIGCLSGIQVVCRKLNVN
ncbi:hypothetical protein [Bradyrhizobium sp. STM 3557]|uniref:hypothetical protein n=1 Tax=Bradyrhizobium sp. STM 3557 TaxID=578920 RepID=UPI00388D30AC